MSNPKHDAEVMRTENDINGEEANNLHAGPSDPSPPPNFVHCQFSGFGFTLFPVIFLVKNSATHFFREIATFTSRLLSFDKFFPTWT